MSKTSRSLITIFSLAFMLLSGIFTPYIAQARGNDTEQQQKSIIWDASPESVAQFQKLAEGMDAKITITNSREARQSGPSRSVRYSDDQVSADELAKLIKTYANNGGDSDIHAIKITIKIGPVTITIEW